MDITVSFRMPEEMKARIDKLVYYRRITKTEYIKAALTQALAQEDGVENHREMPAIIPTEGTIIGAITLPEAAPSQSYNFQRPAMDGTLPEPMLRKARSMARYRHLEAKISENSLQSYLTWLILKDLAAAKREIQERRT